MTNEEIEVLEDLFEETRRTTRSQEGRAGAIDEKAAQLLRFNAILLSILVAAISITWDVWGSSGPPGNVLMVSMMGVGFGALAASTLVAVLAFRATDVRPGLRAEDLGGALQYDVKRATFLRDAIRAYVVGIVRNSRSLERALFRLHIALYSLVAAILAFSCAATVLLLRSVQA